MFNSNENRTFRAQNHALNIYKWYELVVVINVFPPYFFGLVL